ncbi:MAG: hypothetical protein MUF60_08775 [Vicinamibacterales bacterium]|jgi:hypothetical protein|nr:hypothetical protein [Vicinamibacterales bacterium]
MTRYNGTQQAKAGFYFNMDTWHVQTLSGEGGVLEGTSDTRYLRLPLPVLLVVAPLMGAAFAMFLPFIGIALVLDFVAKKVWAAAREAAHGTMMALSPRTRTGEAYFTGDAAKKDATTPDEQADAALAKLEQKIDAHDRKDQQ